MNYGASINYLPELFAIISPFLKIALLCWLLASIVWWRELQITRGMRSVIYMERCCKSCGHLWIVKRDGEIPPCPYCRIDVLTTCNADLAGEVIGWRDQCRKLNDETLAARTECVELRIENDELRLRNLSDPLLSSTFRPLQEEIATLKDKNEQLQRGIDAAEGDRQKAVNDAAKLQVRCAELEIERAQLKAIIAEVAP